MKMLFGATLKLVFNYIKILLPKFEFLLSSKQAINE